MCKMYNEEKIVAWVIDGVLTCFDDTAATDFEIPDTVTAIAGTAFAGCSRLVSLTIPPSVQEIAEGAFDGCTSLAEIIVPEDFTLLDGDALLDTKWFREHEDGLIILGATFLGYRGFTDDVTVPAGIRRIAAGAFVQFGRAASVRLPDTIRIMDAGAFPKDCEPVISWYRV
ncbi:MAG: leucine-rich repeat domain-containing protein [Oscillospiraceae bacterium]|nr:leucine-rich repeat domain-containing protein [Oscillospiraceae bacterium]